MSKDARAWREEAAAATAGGKHKRALAAYLELERIEARDAQWAKRAAEAYRKLGRDSDAIAAYSRSADRYAQNGFLVQAIAVYKLILQIDPQNAETLRRLAAMTDQVGAGPTRVGEMAEHNVNLHDDSRVAMLRQPRMQTVDGSGGFALPSEELDLDDLDQPTTTPPPGRTAPLPVQPQTAAAAPAPRPQVQPPQPHAAPPQQQYAYTQQLPRDVRLPAGAPEPQRPAMQQLPRAVSLPPAAAAPARAPQPQPQQPPRSQPKSQPPPQAQHAAPAVARTRSSPGIAVSRTRSSPQQAIAVSRTRSASISLVPGSGLDSVKMSEAVPESRVHSQAGIYIIPIDDEDLIPEAELDAAVEAEQGDARYVGSSSAEITIDTDSNLPSSIDINIDTQPPKRKSDVSMEMSPDDVIDLAPNSVEEATELELEDLEEIPLAAPKQLGAQSLAALQATPLFSGMPSAALEALVSRLAVVTLDVGDVLFREGEPGDSLYVVVEGEIVMQSEGPPRHELARFGPDSYIGEVALVTDQPRAATATAAGPTELLQIDRATLAAVLAEHGDVLRAILRFVRDRLVDRWTRTSPLFRPFDDSARAELAGRFKFLEIEGGTVLLTAGNKPDGLYIILAGQFAVQRANGSQIAALGPGELIGETALLSGGTFKSKVVALGRSLALCLPAGQFREIIMTHPHVLEYIGEQAEHARKLQIV